MTTTYLPPTGGLPVIRPAPLTFGPDAQQGITLISDTHFGAANADEALIRAELERARACGDRVLLGGDVFDLILPSDRRRYTPGAVHPRFAGRDDLQNAVVEWAADFLAPYAPLIDAVGIGNHESASIMHHNYDPVRALVKTLNTGLTCHVQEAGYTAYLRWRLLPEKKAKGRPSHFTLWYHHGSGKTASAAGALKNLRSKANHFLADVYWSGHSHTRCLATERVLRPGRGGRVVARDIKLVVTGSYMHAYGVQSRSCMARRGRKSNYASEAAVVPTGLGGARIVLEWGAEGGYPEHVHVTQ